MTRSVWYYTDTDQLGGAERVILTLFAGLDRAVWEPSLVCHRSPGIAPLVQRARDHGAAVIETPPMPLGVVGGRAAVPFARGLRRAGPDVFHAHLAWPLAAKFALVAAVAARVPAVVATVHSFPEFRLDRSSYVQWRFLAYGVDAFIAISGGVADALRTRMHWPRSKIAVIHNGVELDAYARMPGAAVRKSLVGAQTGTLVLTVSRLVEDKGIEHLLAAAAELPDAQFVIAGDGPDRSRLEELALHLRVDDRVTFVGHRDDVPELLTACDMLVLPTLWEGAQNSRRPLRPNQTDAAFDPSSRFLPLAVLEAMAANRPVIMTQLRQGDAITHGVNGLHVPAADPHALSEAIRRLSADRELCDRLAANGLTTVRGSFSAAATVQEVTSLYSSLLAREPKRWSHRRPSIHTGTAEV